MLDPHIFSPLAANRRICGCKGSGFFVTGSVSRSTVISIAFEGVISVLKRGQRALCITHPTSVHHAFQSFTPLDALPSSQLQRLEFVYTATIQEALTAITTINVEEDDAPHVVLLDISSLDDAGDLMGVLRLVALLDNTIRSLRELQSTHEECFSLVALVANGPLVGPAPSLHTALPFYVVPNPILIVEATENTVAVSLILGAAGDPLSAGRSLLFHASLCGAVH
jgi:hypothetical protein